MKYKEVNGGIFYLKTSDKLERFLNKYNLINERITFLNDDISLLNNQSVYINILSKLVNDKKTSFQEKRWRIKFILNILNIEDIAYSNVETLDDEKIYYLHLALILVKNPKVVIITRRITNKKAFLFCLKKLTKYIYFVYLETDKKI